VGEKRHYVACIDLNGRSVLVVGGGRVGLDKVFGLLECGADVTVVAPEMLPELAALPVQLGRRRYRSSDLAGRYLVVAATSDTALNRRVFADAEDRRLLCNVVDVPELCSFILPAVHRRDPITVAVSTGGASPALAQRLRDDIAGLVEARHAALAVRLREQRPWAKEHLPTYEARRDHFARLVRDELG
jgi:precorrin-2 dehydrogenase / sirohydrochlorin ferrochelatase